MTPVSEILPMDFSVAPATGRYINDGRVGLFLMIRIPVSEEQAMRAYWFCRERLGAERDGVWFAPLWIINGGEFQLWDEEDAFEVKLRFG